MSYSNILTIRLSLMYIQYMVLFLRFKLTKNKKGREKTEKSIRHPVNK